jgi:hypothetical protein
MLFLKSYLRRIYNMTSTTREALLAELLCDVSKLHDGIKALPDSLSPTLDTILAASQEAKMTIEHYTQAQKKLIDGWVQAEIHSLKSQISAAIETAVGEAIKDAAFALNASAQLLDKEIKAKKFSLWSYFGVGLGAGVLGSVLTMLGVGIWYL